MQNENTTQKTIKWFRGEKRYFNTKKDRFGDVVGQKRPAHSSALAGNRPGTILFYVSFSITFCPREGSFMKGR